MRKLVAIALAVIVIVAVVVYFGRSTETTVTPAAAREQPASPSHDDSPVATDDVSPSASINSESSPPAQLSDEQRQQAACAAMWNRKAESGRAALAAEPKDPAWAYAMEEKLRDYTARRFQGTAIDVIGIDCKTSFCDVTAQGSVETASAFAEGIAAITAEPWSKFSGSGSSHTEESGKVIHHGHVSRDLPSAQRTERPTAAELACYALQEKQQQRRRAAEDAQPRDASWADPMEQLLRQHITGQLAQYSFNNLDISCRTTYCKVSASGRARESLGALDKATTDAAAQPWAENLWLAGRAGSVDGESWDQSFTLYRRDKRL